MLKLKAKIRESKDSDKLRQEGRLPAVVYGHGIENKSIDLNYEDVRKLLEKAGESTLIELDVEGNKPLTVLCHDVQYNPLNNAISHVDFYQIKEGEKIDVSIEFNLVGESPAVKELKGNLVKPHDKVEVRCLPSDLVSHIDVDISV
ncbi:MAG: 50S ribosomal protein L25, partial [Patescibacteria group bacterium]